MIYTITGILKEKDAITINIDSGDIIVFQPFGSDIIGTTTPQWLYKSNSLYKEIRTAIWQEKNLEQFIYNL